MQMTGMSAIEYSSIYPGTALTVNADLGIDFTGKLKLQNVTPHGSPFSRIFPRNHQVLHHVIPYSSHAHAHARMHDLFPLIYV